MTKFGTVNMFLGVCHAPIPSGGAMAYQNILGPLPNPTWFQLEQPRLVW